MNRLIQDLRHAVRRLRKAPGFALVAVFTLALGIGATTTLFSVVHGILLRPLPYPDPERIVRVFEVGEDGRRPAQMADPNFVDLSRQSRSFEALAQYQTSLVSIFAEGEAARVTAAQVSRQFFDVMGVEPRLGRPFDPSEQREGTAPVALVSHDFWQRHLESDEDLAGRTLTYGDAVAPVIGVLPPGFRYPAGADVWTPRELEPMTPSRTALNKKVIGRLADGVSLDQARQDVSAVARRLKERHGDDVFLVDAALIPLRETLVGDTRPALLLLLGASALLLLIACANVVNLLLARAASQRRDLAVRMALGAGRGRIHLRALSETLLLALAGGALGLLLARWGVGFLLGLEAAADLPRATDVRVDGTVLAFALGVSLAVAICLALLAAWRATRVSVRDTLAAGRRSEAGSGRSPMRGTLIVAQVALTLMLLVGTGLLLRSFQQLLDVDPGFRTGGALVVNPYLPWPQDEDQMARQSTFHERLISRLEALPGVTEVGAINALPLRGRGANGTFVLLQQPDEVEDWDDFGALADDPLRSGNAQYRQATTGYFSAMRIPLLRGRLFETRDRPGTRHVAVVSESLARTTWPDGSALGKLVQYGNMDGDLRPYTVVGVVGDVRDAGLEAEPSPTFYANAHQRPRGLTGPQDVVVVPQGDPSSLITAARRVVRELDPQVAPTLGTLEEIYAGSLAERRFQILLLGVFAAVALVLALVGLYGVISFHVSRRRAEIGVRIALGARVGNVVWMVVRRGLILAGLGVAIGLAGAFLVSRLMRSLLYGVTPSDPTTLLAVSLLLLTAALLASLLPARRAARVDPQVALRAE